MVVSSVYIFVLPVCYVRKITVMLLGVSVIISAMGCFIPFLQEQN